MSGSDLIELARWFLLARYSVPRLHGVVKSLSRPDEAIVLLKMIHDVVDDVLERQRLSIMSFLALFLPDLLANKAQVGTFWHESAAIRALDCFM